jgi:BASS family bile acid:Na+ symporter
MVLVPFLRLWHNSDEVATIAIGLALVASMPVAGSSTGWAHHAGGDMALSLGLVLASTLVSPLSAPMALGLVGRVAPSGAAAALESVAKGEVGGFLLACVLVPSLLGILVRRRLPEQLGGHVDRALKPTTTLILLLLCYANASACLPQVFHRPDWDFLGALILMVLGMCAVTFWAGYLLGEFLGADRRQRAALIFGLGMNNNGTGLVLASVALSARPTVLLPIIIYNLSQHLVAGFVGGNVHRERGL